MKFTRCTFVSRDRSISYERLIIYARRISRGMFTEAHFLTSFFACGCHFWEIYSPPDASMFLFSFFLPRKKGRFAMHTTVSETSAMRNEIAR